MRFWKNFILPVSLLAGTIIGAGIFSLPYVFSRAGLFWSFLLLIVFTLVFCVVHLMYADLILKNSDRHRFAGFARIYFGEKGYWLSILGTVVEMFFVLVIYLVLSASFISLIFPRLPIVWGVIIFWWLGSLAIFAGTKRVALFEFLATAGILAVVALIAVWGVPQFLEKDFSLISSDYFLWFLPFGPLLFSLNGRPAVPSLIHYFNRIGRPDYLGDSYSGSGLFIFRFGGNWAFGKNNSRLDFGSFFEYFFLGFSFNFWGFGNFVSFELLLFHRFGCEAFFGI